MKDKNTELLSVISSKLPFSFFCLICIFFLVMFIGGFNFLSMFALAIAMILPILMIPFVARKSTSIIWIFFSYIVIVLGNLIFYLVWGADPFIDRAFNNIALSIAPLGLALIFWFLPRICRAKDYRWIAVIILIAMTLSNLLYFFAAAFRVRPRVESMKSGHDEYLASMTDTSANSPNILIVLMDDMGYSDLSSYSYLGESEATIKTPNIDALADDGVLMENFYSASPVCSPSRFSLLTGRYCSRGYLDEVVFPTKVSWKPFGTTRFFNPVLFKHNVDGILGDEITIAEALKSAGYNTGAIGKWNLGDYGQYLPTNQGFNYFYGSHYVNDMTPYNWVREVNGEPIEVLTHYDIEDQSETTKMLTQEVNGFINSSIDNNQKFFAYYATPWPHYPIFSGVKGDTSDDCYIDCIEEFDSYLGTIIQNLKNRGVYDDTLIIFSSDNGPGREGSSGALRGRKGTTFEGGQKVPFIATYVNGGIGKAGTLQASNVIKSTAMNIDLFPTILSYAGIDNLPSDRIIDGVNIRNLLEGTIPVDQPMHESLYYIAKGKVLAVQKPLSDGENISVFKYYEKVQSENTAFFDQVYRNYLFNLSIDPIEAYNISMAYPEIALSLKEDLLFFREQLKENQRGIIKDN